MGTVLFLVYLASVAHALQLLSVAGIIFLGAVGVVGLAICAHEDAMEAYSEAAKKCLPWAGLFFVLAIFTPDKTLLYIAAGLKASEEIVETAVAQKALSVLDAKLDELLSDTD